MPFTLCVDPPGRSDPGWISMGDPYGEFLHRMSTKGFYDAKPVKKISNRLLWELLDVSLCAEHT